MTTEMTITEALAELKTIAKRIASKRAAVTQYLFRDAVLRDPHEANGGSKAFVAAERQALRDLRQRYANIRIAINRVNMETAVELLGTTRTIAEWIVWKREIHTMHAEELNAIANSIKTVRTKAASLGKQISSDKDSTGPQDVIVNLVEAAVLKEAEELAATLSTLDGKLSLVNATVRITV